MHLFVTLIVLFASLWVGMVVILMMDEEGFPVWKALMNSLGIFAVLFAGWLVTAFIFTH